MTNCKNCGAPINMHANSCPYCGSPYIEVYEPHYNDAIDDTYFNDLIYQNNILKSELEELKFDIDGPIKRLYNSAITAMRKWSLKEKCFY